MVRMGVETHGFFPAAGRRAIALGPVARTLVPSGFDMARATLFVRARSALIYRTRCQAASMCCAVTSSTRLSPHPQSIGGEKTCPGQLQPDPSAGERHVLFGAPSQQAPHWLGSRGRVLFGALLHFCFKATEGFITYRRWVQNVGEGQPWKEVALAAYLVPVVPCSGWLTVRVVGPWMGIVPLWILAWPDTD